MYKNCVLYQVLLVAVALSCINATFSTSKLSTIESSPMFGEDTVTIKDGTVQGVVYESARAFFSIPYAAPPTGSNRFQPPKAPAPWNGVLLAKKYGPGCPQDCILPPFTCPVAGYSEDCLKVDVYTPRLSTIQEEGKRPVMVFIYGGAFVQGGSSTPLYNGNFLANNTKVVVVVINYRLGALGFFLNNKIAGNNAIRDQTFAMKWVKNNIEAFGGNSSNVTIFGQSAGASSVACHMVSPDSANLFDAAIMQSNPLGVALLTPSKAHGVSKRFAKSLNCNVNDFECLNSKNVSEILHAQAVATKFLPLSPLTVAVAWEPYVDEKYIPQQPLYAFQQGNYHQVPFMLGNVESEGIMFAYSAFTSPISPALYPLLLKAVFYDKAKEVEELYPVADGATDARPILSTLATDYLFACPNRNISFAMNTRHPVYLYHFDHIMSFDPWGPHFAECSNYSCHGAELPFIFNSAHLAGYDFSTEEKVLSRSMSTSWGNFATSASPNHPFKVSLNETFNWPLFDSMSDKDMEFKTPKSSVETNYRKKYCDYWDSIGYWYGNSPVPPKLAKLLLASNNITEL